MRRIFLGAVLGLALALPLVGSAGAQPDPGGGPDFGRHVAEMAPAHPMDHGRDFGGCVSGLATTGECDHHP
jgi:hypothetical protein